MAVFVTQYNSSLSSFVPNFRALSQGVAEKSLTEKRLQTDRQTNINIEKSKTIYLLYYRQTDKQKKNKQTDKHNYRKGENYIPPIYFVLGV